MEAVAPEVPALRGSRGRVLLGLCLLAVPALVAWGGRDRAACYERGLFFDPEHAYLFNALHVARGHAPAHWHHPGTPVQILGAAVIHGVHAAAGGGSDLVDDVLRDPQGYLFAINRTLFGAYLLGLVAAGWVAAWATGRTLAGVLVQATPLLASSAMVSLYHVSPEPLVLLIDLGFAALLVCHVARGPSGAPRLYPYAFGVACGVGLATRVGYLPLLLVPIVLARSWPERARFAIAVLLSLLVSLLPIWTLLPQVARWYWGLATHRGLYGKGEVGGFDLWDSMEKFYRFVVREDPVAFLLLLATAAAGLAWRFVPRLRSPEAPAGAGRALLALALSHLLQGLVVLKQPYGARYAIPNIGILGAGLWIAAAGFRRPAAVPARRALATAFGVALALSALASYRQSKAVRKDFRRQGREVVAVEEAVRTRYAGFRVIHSVGSRALPMLLWNGDRNSGARLGARLKRLYPREFFYVPWRSPDEYYDWTRPVTLEEIRRENPRVIFVCRPLFDPVHASFGVSFHPPRPALRDALRGRSVTIYEVVESPTGAAGAPPSPPPAGRVGGGR